MKGYVTVTIQITALVTVSYYSLILALWCFRLISTQTNQPKPNEHTKENTHTHTHTHSKIANYLANNQQKYSQSTTNKMRYFSTYLFL